MIREEWDVCASNRPQARRRVEGSFLSQLLMQALTQEMLGSCSYWAFVFNSPRTGTLLMLQLLSQPPIGAYNTLSRTNPGSSWSCWYWDITFNSLRTGTVLMFQLLPQLLLRICSTFAKNNLTYSPFPSVCLSDQIAVGYLGTITILICHRSVGSLTPGTQSSLQSLGFEQGCDYLGDHSQPSAPFFFLALFCLWMLSSILTDYLYCPYFINDFYNALWVMGSSLPLLGVRVIAASWLLVVKCLHMTWMTLKLQHPIQVNEPSTRSYCYHHHRPSVLNLVMLVPLLADS